MKNERLIALMDCLLLEGRQTAEGLARRFEVSVRTIYRDLDSLCAAGLPLVAEAGRGGGYEIERGYRIDRSFLSPEELADLRSILAAFTSATHDRNLERSLGKIASLGPREAALARRGRGSKALLARGEASPEGRGELPPPLIANLSPWGPPACEPRLLEELRRSIAERRVLSFAYADSEGRETRREVEPFSVVIGGATWYLHGWCRLRNAFRLFKISRIKELHTTSEVYDPWRRSPYPQPFAFEGASESLARVEVSVEGRLAPALEEAFPGRGRGPDAEGRWSYRFEYPHGSYLISFLLYFGPGLRVESPESLRAELAWAAGEIVRANASPAKP
ncbi:MAG TPA: YafY family protein [Spirochaetia bacterium]|nr:YafY family protein [Spirochaetia bacterium]